MKKTVNVRKSTKKEKVKRKAVIAFVAVVAATVITAGLWGVTHLIELLGYCATALLGSGVWPWIAMGVIWGVMIFLIFNIPKKRSRRRRR